MAERTIESQLDNRARWYQNEYLLVREAWYDDDDDNWDPRSRELLLDPYLPPYYRAVLLTMIIHTDDNPREILDYATKMVEELEAMVIAENVEDEKIKQLRKLVQFLEDNFFEEGWTDSEAGVEMEGEQEGSVLREAPTTAAAAEEGDEENSSRLSSQATLAEGGTDAMNDDEEERTAE